VQLSEELFMVNSSVFISKTGVGRIADNVLGIAFGRVSEHKASIYY